MSFIVHRGRTSSHEVRDFSFHRLADDVERLTGTRPSIVWRMCWKYISPLALLVVLGAVIFQHSKAPPSYLSYVGCVQVMYEIAQVFH